MNQQNNNNAMCVINDQVHRLHPSHNHRALALFALGLFIKTTLIICFIACVDANYMVNRKRVCPYVCVCALLNIY